jgi:hypothetical protein
VSFPGGKFSTAVERAQLRRQGIRLLNDTPEQAKRDEAILRMVERARDFSSGPGVTSMRRSGSAARLRGWRAANSFGRGPASPPGRTAAPVIPLPTGAAKDFGDDAA